MKRILKAMLVVGALFSCLVSGAWAYPVSQGDTVTISDGLYGTTDGGEFKVTNGANGASFTTFCLEKDEYILRNGGTYSIESISDTAQLGGKNTNSGDPLDDKTKWLYWNYIYGYDNLDKILTGMTYSKDQLADAVQYMIWSIEEEYNYSTPGTVSDIIAKLNTNYSSPDVIGNVIGNVAAINLVTHKTDGTIENNQSLLVAEPVPEPGTMVLLGAGMLGLAVFGKRRMNREA